MTKQKIVFLHPDLGIGGAERLVIDAAMELSRFGYEVVMYTTYHDAHRCFEETLSARGTRAAWIRVHGGWMPRQIFGLFHAPLAYLRTFWCAAYLILVEKKVSVVFIDQVAAPILLFRLLTTINVLFYCHYPDLLLAGHSSWFRRLYRLPLNYIEKLSTGLASKILVNSKYTSAVFARTFKGLYISGTDPSILYPAVQSHQDQVPQTMEYTVNAKRVEEIMNFNGTFFLSINRFERKKNLGLALKAFAHFKRSFRKYSFDGVKLILAGGFDKRLKENVEYFKDLQREARDLRLFHEVVMLQSISSEEKAMLISRCSCVLYTPVNEHFGIVPLEAMAAGKPVVACNSGGPVETIIDGITGFVCAPLPEDFSTAMQRIFSDPAAADRMGNIGRQHVKTNFCREKFGEELHFHIKDVFTKDIHVKGKMSARRACLPSIIFAAVLCIPFATCFSWFRSAWQMHEIQR